MFYTVFIESENYEKICLKNCRPSDIIKGFKDVSKVDLEDCIDPENGLLNRLRDHGIIDNDEINYLERMKIYRSRNSNILGKLEKNINSSSEQFIQALCDDEQEHIGKFIVTSGCETNSGERLLPRELRRVIDSNMFCLEKLIDTEKRDLLHQLVRAKMYHCTTPRQSDTF